MALAEQHYQLLLIREIDGRYGSMMGTCRYWVNRWVGPDYLKL